MLRSMIKKRKIRGAYGVKFAEPWGSKHESGGKYATYIGNERDKYRLVFVVSKGLKVILTLF